MATLSRNLHLKPYWNESQRGHPKRLTHIVCTIGPNTKSVEMLEKLLDAGMDILRLNFSHGTHQYHGEVVDNLRQALKNKGPDYRCAIMLDTKGPEVRTGKLKNKTVRIEAGKEIKVCVDTTLLGDENMIAIDYKELATSVKVGGKILIADGTISLTVKSIDEENKIVTCMIDHTSTLGENKNVHLPGAVVKLPAVSEKDKDDLAFGVEKEVDLIAASFIRQPKDVLEIRNILGAKGKHIKIISKIESTEGLENVKAILDVSDGIMVARGDLGVELPLQQIFIAQKMMISLCNAANKPVITATQMLESMIQNPRPTRAEATDVANAVLDGTDCVMLSGETASGNFPLEAVTYMNTICLEAEGVEAVTDYPSMFEALREQNRSPDCSEVVCSYAVRAANDLHADLIMALTETGSTARLISKYRPRVPILCITNTHHTANFLQLSRACIPVLVPTMKGTESIIVEGMNRAKKLGLCKSGSVVVVVHGTLEGNPGNSNLLKVLVVP